MGCDGGTIPKRNELVKEKKKEEQKDKNADILAKWRYCALSCNELRLPIVACELGYLYNKESVIEYLLNREVNSNSKFSHIRGLRDVTVLNLTEKSDYQNKPTDNGNDYVDNQDSRFICPVTGLEMNGKYRFLFFRECGCVISERAYKEIKCSNVCLKCNKSIDIKDYIIINSTDEEIKKYKENMEIRRAEAKLKNKVKKRKLETNETDNKSNNKVNTQTIKIKSKDKPSCSKNSSTKSSTSSILPPTARDDYSVANDPEKSEAFKSLFTSHESAVKPKAHWVTYNPLYF